MHTPSSPPSGEALTPRVVSTAAVIAVHALLLLLLLRLAPPAVPPVDRATPTTIELLPEAQVAPATTRAEKAGGARAAAARAAPDTPEPEAQPPPPPPPPPAAPAPSAIWSQLVPLTREEVAAADIARLPSRPREGTAAVETGGSGDALAAGTDDGPGTGPNGERLYNAEWFRKPTRAELATYLPARSVARGWGMIACQTVAGNRVEDCREIGQYPAGSGLARAVREAAWQFRVLPPRIGGRPMVGSWVRIRIDYTAEGGG